MVLRVFVLVALVTNVLVNVVVPRGDAEVGAVSARTEPLLSAAGWAFSIWGVIFAWTVAYGLWQALPRTRDRAVAARIGPFVIVNALGSAAWTLLFTSERFVAAWVVMLAILASLLVIERRTFGLVGAEHFIVRAPFTLNLGWIAVATILNTAQLTGQLAEGVARSVAFTAACIAVAGLVGTAIVVAARARWAGAAAAWGLAAVAAEMGDKGETALARLAVACSALVVASILTSLLASRRRRHEVERQRT